MSKHLSRLGLLLLDAGACLDAILSDLCVLQFEHCALLLFPGREVHKAIGTCDRLTGLFENLYVRYTGVLALYDACQLLFTYLRIKVPDVDLVT